MSEGPVRCMLLPLVSMHLIIPNSAVAEIISYSAPKKLADCSDWFLGLILWRGAYVPMISVETMYSAAAADSGPRSRIAIIYNPEKDESLPYIGVHIQDIPRAYLARQDAVETPSGEALSRYLSAPVDDDQFVLAVPNLDAIVADLKPQLHHSPLA